MKKIRVKEPGKWYSWPGKLGIRYREHPTRKYNRAPDRYFAIRYRVLGKRHEEGIGWASEGYTADRAEKFRALVIERSEALGRHYSLSEHLSEDTFADPAAAALKALLAEQARATFGQACDRYIVWATSHKKSWHVDHGHIRHHLAPFLGAYRLADITPSLVEAFRTHLHGKLGRLGRPLSASTIVQCCMLVSRVFSVARLIPFRDDTPQLPMWTGQNPCAEIRVKKPANNSRWRILTDDQTAAILQVALDLRILNVRKRYMTINHAMVFHDAILFSRHTGARLGETCGLRWAFTDLERNTLRLTDTKSGKDRTVFADQECMDMLRRRSVRDHAETHVFWDANRPMEESRLTKAFTRAVNHLGLNDGFTRDQDRIVFHSLRHTYGTMAIMAGMNPAVLQRLMGHSSLAVTERYIHLAEEFMRGAVHG